MKDAPSNPMRTASKDIRKQHLDVSDHSPEVALKRGISEDIKETNGAYHPFKNNYFFQTQFCRVTVLCIVMEKEMNPLRIIVRQCTLSELRHQDSTQRIVADKSRLRKENLVAVES
eukprot:1997856-Amphidinium_carterae.1